MTDARSQASRFLRLLGLSLCVQSVFAAVAAQGISAMPLSCEVTAEMVNGFLQLQAVGQSSAAATGHYRLEVAKHSASGSSTNMQSGDFALRAGERKVLSTVVLDGSARGHFDARLTLESDQGSVSCSQH